MFGPLATDMYLPGLPSLTRALHASASAGQLTLTSSVLGIALGQLLTGPISDARGRTRPLLAGLIGFSVTSLLCAISPSVWALIASRLFQGIAGGAGIVIARAIVRDLFGGNVAARVFALLMMMSGIAPVFAPLIGGQVLALTSWRGVFVVLAGIGALLVLLAWVRVPETLPRERRHRGGLRPTFSTFGRLLRDRHFAPYVVSFALSFGAMFAFIAGGSYVLENVYGISPQLFSAVFAVNSFALAGVSQVSAQLVARIGPARLLRYGLWGVAAGSAGALAACIAHSGIWPLLVALLVVLAANGLVLPNAVAAAMGNQPDALGSASGLVGVAQFGIGAVIAPLVGLGGAHDALPMGILMAGCACVSLAVNLGLSREPSSSSRA
jgi:DHA1 family bicyclomycin/chloramphenicol resistance-like MFS transporter